MSETPPVPAADLEWVLPEFCPGCGEPAKGKILTCERCWNRFVPERSRRFFARLYFRDPKNVEAYRKAGQVIIANLKQVVAAFKKTT